MDSRTIQVTWDPPLAEEQNGVIQHYLVVVMVRQTLTSLSLNATSTSLTLSDLHPAYDYSIEVAAVTIGVGPFSAAISVTTPDDGKKFLHLLSTLNQVQALFVSRNSVENWGSYSKVNKHRFADIYRKTGRMVEHSLMASSKLKHKYVIFIMTAKFRLPACIM